MSHEVFLHAVWPSSVPLTADVADKLCPYVTRYAQTFKASVLAVGVNEAGDALHLLVQLPEDISIKVLMNGLQTPAARYAATALGAAGLTFAAAVTQSVSPSALDEWQARITSGDLSETETDTDAPPDSDTLPDWLQEALGRKSKP